MAASTYDEALRRLLVHEGGYSNHPSDPGGPTNFGITIADYRKYVKPDATAADVRDMSRATRRRRIYRKRYWDVQRCDELPAGVDYSIFDYGVNSGIGRSGKVLRRVVGLPDNTSAVTDQVLAYARVRDPKVLVAAICDERLAFLKSLRTWPVFGRGWGTRVAEVEGGFARVGGRSPRRHAERRRLSARSGTPPWLARMNAILGLYEFSGARRQSSHPRHGAGVRRQHRPDLQARRHALVRAHRQLLPRRVRPARQRQPVGARFRALRRPA